MKKAPNAMGRAKGFTLVEMLIVITIIGLLAGMTMILTGPATGKAEAARIVSDMRTVKTACVMCGSDAGGWPAEKTEKPDKYPGAAVSGKEFFPLPKS